MPILKQKRSFSFLQEYAAGKINDGYLENMFNDKSNKYKVHAMNENANFNEITTLIYYRKTSQTNRKIRYVLLVFLVHPLLRSMGYGIIAMMEFLEYIRHDTKTVEIILHSLEESIPFYNKLGFTETAPTNFIKTYEKLDKHEKCFVKKLSPTLVNRQCT
tara:strand:+ start:942 stop:1421 length:480 start_codon:yes stop_codon:yes gene_type:complete